jgi:DNA-binding LytR/AlgR family response regulator
MRCLAVDDEPLALTVIRQFCKRTPFLSLEWEALSAIEAKKIIQDNPVDLVFLDINMPNMNGIELIQELEDAPLVIFTTAYPEFAISGYELDVVDYLLKPFSFDRFTKAVTKAQELFTIRQNAATISEADYMMIRVEYSTVRIEINEIDYIEGLKDYIKIYTRNGKNYVTKSSMKNISERLPQNFIRAHKSYIVNMERVTALKNNVIQIGQQQIPLGALNKNLVIERMQDKLL